MTIEAGDCTSSGIEVTKAENATKVYADLKEEYIALKASLRVADVNLAEIDRIKW